MKKLVLLFILMSTPAMAGDSKEVVKTAESLITHGISKYLNQNHAGTVEDIKNSKVGATVPYLSPLISGKVETRMNHWTVSYNYKDDNVFVGFKVNF